MTAELTAIVLAAGLSTRMGQPKMLLPWGEHTVLEQVISTISESGIKDILVITGGEKEAVERLVADRARKVFNEHYRQGEMLSSIQAGLRHASGSAAMIVLGDQPQVQAGTVLSILKAYQETGSGIIVPSYQFRRGHPWLIAKTHWEEVLNLRTGQSPRDFFKKNEGLIHYVVVDDPGILQDIDTPDQYEQYRPKSR